MSLQLDNEIPIENIKELKVLSFGVGVESRELQVNYGLGSTTNGKFMSATTGSVTITGEEFDAVISTVPEVGLSLYEGLKIELYKIIKAKTDFEGSVV